MFRRLATQPTTPTGGTWADPVPTTSGWSDGVPAGEDDLWFSTRTFTISGNPPQNAAWSTPARAADDVNIEFRWSNYNGANPGTPDAPIGGAVWTETSSLTSIWMAIRNKSSGQWGAWSVTKIKGEDGSDAPVPEFRWAKNSSTSVYPTISVNTRNPGAAWQTNRPGPSTILEGEHVWETQALINADNTLYSNWRMPLRITGERGIQGI